jgi:hypothetical protein
MTINFKKYLEDAKANKYEENDYMAEEPSIEINNEEISSDTSEG